MPPSLSRASALGLGDPLQGRMLDGQDIGSGFLHPARRHVTRSGARGIPRCAEWKRHEDRCRDSERWRPSVRTATTGNPKAALEGQRAEKREQWLGLLTTHLEAGSFSWAQPGSSATHWIYKHIPFASSSMSGPSVPYEGQPCTSQQERWHRTASKIKDTLTWGNYILPGGVTLSWPTGDHRFWCTTDPSYHESGCRKKNRWRAMLLDCCPVAQRGYFNCSSLQFHDMEMNCLRLWVKFLMQFSWKLLAEMCTYPPIDSFSACNLVVSVYSLRLAITISQL